MSGARSAAAWVVRLVVVLGTVAAPLGIGGLTGPTRAAGTGPTSGTVYYVSPSGSDSASGRSPLTAWRTLGKVTSATLKPGDRVLLRRGARYTGELEIDESGTPTAPITVGAYGLGATPTVTGSCYDLDGSHLRLRRVRADACDWAGFSVSGDDVVLSRVVATGSVTGVHIRDGADDAVVRRSVIRDNVRMSVNTPGGDDDSGAFGVLVQGDGAVIRRNRISGHVAKSYDYGDDGAAVEIYGAIGTRVTHNLATDNNAFTELGDPRTADTTYAYNLVTSDLPEATFLVTRGAGSSWGPIVGTDASHNTVHLTGERSQGFVCHDGCGSDVLTMRANVIAAEWKVGYADAGFAGGHNVWHGGQRQFAMLAGDVVAVPGWVAPSRGNYRLARRSPAVDREPGTAWQRDLLGGPVPRDGDRDGKRRPDAGAIERR